MEKFKSEAEIIQATKEAFEANEKAKALYVSTDAQCFLEESKNAALLHSRKAGVDVKLVSRSEFYESLKASKPTKAAAKANTAADNKPEGEGDTGTGTGTSEGNKTEEGGNGAPDPDKGASGAKASEAAQAGKATSKKQGSNK